jgi:uncharacterized protein (TIGR02452 family)
MAGRPLFGDDEAEARGFVGRECSRRRAVLRETLEAFERSDPADAYHRLASRNLERWRNSAVPRAGLHVEVLPGDWGEVTHRLTAKYGQCFAVLNMANAHVPGGAYVEGAVAQEENIFRRTDCHFQISHDEYDATTDRYLPTMTRLLTARDGMVYLDSKRPRVCIRGPEDRTGQDLGYPWLAEEDVFPFWELRASAQDLRAGQPFDEAEAQRRISAQFSTLIAHGVKHVVFGAFGCGAFRNPADLVASIYRDEIRKHAPAFRVIAFAIFHAGYGPGNFTPFHKALGGLPSQPDGL